MRAARLNAHHTRFAIEDLPTPVPGPGEVLIRVAAAGVCHSDLHIAHGELPGLPLPNTLGHENAGHVEAFGPGAEDQGLAVGDPVVVFGGWGCGHCRVCLGGTEQLCDTLLWGGLGPAGGYAEYMVVPSVRHLLPAGALDLTEAATLTDAGLSAYSAVRKALPVLAPGTTAVLIGAGGLGQYGIQVLKLLSPATVVVVETSDVRRELALTLGADVAIDPSTPDAESRIREHTGEDGAAAVLDFVGVDATMALGTALLRRQGMFVLVGLAGGSAPFSAFGTAREAFLTTSSWGSRNELEDVLALARQGRLVSTIETHPLSDVNDVFDRLERGLIIGRAVLVP